MLTSDMKAIVESSKLGFVATVCEDGSPNLSPKGSVHVFDDHHLVFADIASLGTIENLLRDPRIEINCVDFLRRRGYRFKGTAQVIEPGDDPVYRDVTGRLGPEMPVHHAVLVRVEQAGALDSPAYTVLGGREEDVVKSWTTRYMNAAALGQMALRIALTPRPDRALRSHLQHKDTALR